MLLELVSTDELLSELSVVFSLLSVAELLEALESTERLDSSELSEEDDSDFDELELALDRLLELEFFLALILLTVCEYSSLDCGLAVASVDVCTMLINDSAKTIETNDAGEIKGGVR